MGRCWPLCVAVVLAAPPIASAQSPSELVARAVEAYDDLDLATAVGLIRRALAVQGPETLSLHEELRALSYLGAAEFYRDNQDSVLAAFQRIVKSDPRFQIDDLVFPPEVTSLFALVRRDTKVVRAEVPAVDRFRAGSERWTAQLYASSYHEILAAVARADGSLLRVLYSGLIGDSLEIYWDGLDSARTPVGAGRYFLTAQSTGRTGNVVRLLRVPLDVSASEIDTVPLPPRPADSLFLPERTSRGPALEALAGGVIGGVAVALLPSALASDTDPSASRFLVGGAMTIAGFVGFFKQRGGQPIAENIAANEALIGEWRLRYGDAARRNEELRAQVDLEIRAGPPTLVDLEGP
jgi:hypothetical protein